MRVRVQTGGIRQWERDKASRSALPARSLMDRFAEVARVMALPPEDRPPIVMPAWWGSACKRADDLPF